MKKAAIILFSIVMVMMVLTACSNDKSAQSATGASSYDSAAHSEANKEENYAQTTQSSSESGAPSDFVLEGKWKSVGETGIGQAQPGAIVVFNGTNCNVYSPKDTYAFYSEGDEFHLDCTSFLFADTLTLDVKIVDNDTVELIYGNQITKLRRIG